MNDKSLFSPAKNEEKVVVKNYYKDFINKTLKSLDFIIPTITLLIIFISSFVIYNFVDISYYTRIDFSNAFIKPCLKYPFGTNEFGQNQFFIVMSATFKTLLLAFIATIIDAIIGVIIGILWATNKKFNNLMFVIKNLFDNTPMIFFFIIISLFLKEGFIPLLIIIVLFQWIEFAFITRNNLIHIKTRDYNQVSKLYKTPFYKVLINNYLPSLLPIIFNNIALCIPKIINLEITVSYFGFSIGKNRGSLGTLVYNSISNSSYFTHPYIFLVPFLILFIINLCVFFISKSISKFSTKEGQSC